MDAKRLQSLYAATGIEPTPGLGMPVLLLADAAQLPGLAATLRDSLGFDMLLDVTAVDWADRRGGQPRFEVVWHFWSSTAHDRVRVKAPAGVHAEAQAAAGACAQPGVPSLVSLYGSAAFMERECHDMMGITFGGNADLRPILLYEGFQGHPLRKDYDKRHEQPLVRYRDGRPGAAEG
ncbi:MAG: NADH-quinone oxidoreductase subunit C [Rubrivivax sp.]|nr:NADH-quinone oxidoreductase subunit C [Rubrivivax sp.]